MTLSRVDTMLIMQATGKYSAVVIGVVNNPADADRALMLIDGDIKNLESALEVARAAKDYISVVKSTGSTITEEGSSDGRT